MVNRSPQHDRFDELLEQLAGQVEGLHARIRALKKENKRLRDQLIEIRTGQMDIFSHIRDTDRMKLKSAVSELIERIDARLADDDFHEEHAPTDPRADLPRSSAS